MQNDIQMVAIMRFLLAFSALMIIFINPSEPDRYVVQTYTTMILYVIYSAAILLFIRYGSKYFGTIQKYLHWTDLMWYLLLISLSSGTSSIFFMPANLFTEAILFVRSTRPIRQPFFGAINIQPKHDKVI